MYSTTYFPEQKLWKGNEKLPLFHPNASVNHILLHMLSRQPNKIAQISDDSGKSFTNSEIKVRAIRVAQYLQNVGYEKGDVIGIVAKNGYNLTPAFFGGLLIGLPINALDTCFNVENDIKHMIGRSKPKLILCDSDVLENVQDAVHDLNLNATFITCDLKVDGYLFLDELFIETGKEDNFRATKLINASNELALMLCSSGTTGDSKCVALLYAQVLDCLNQIWEVTAEDTLFSFSSLYWLTGIATMIFGTISGATRIITKERFTPELFFKIIQK